MGIVVAGVSFILYYKFYLSRKLDRKETIELLRTRGIGDRPETIVKDYYKKQGKILNEKEVRKLTNDYLSMNKDFFITMWEYNKKTEEDKS